jgi:hypothetical protein
MIRWGRDRRMLNRAAGARQSGDEPLRRVDVGAPYWTWPGELQQPFGAAGAGGVLTTASVVLTRSGSVILTGSDWSTVDICPAGEVVGDAGELPGQVDAVADRRWVAQIPGTRSTLRQVTQPQDALRRPAIKLAARADE